MTYILDVKKVKTLNLITSSAGLAVAETLEEICSLKTKIKWPNDIILSSGKVCGILTKLITENNEIKYALIGIGINVINETFPGDIKNIVSAVKRSKSKYVMEVKIPLDKLGTAERGALWKLHAARYIANNRCLSIDGTALHDTAAYRGVVIGSPLLKNGTFENLNNKGLPENWNTKNCQIIKSGASNSVKLTAGSHIYQFLTHPELNQQPLARKIKVTFRASGKGTVNVYAVRYNDTQDAKAKYGYRRKFFSTQQFYKANLSGKQTLHTCEYTINPDEWIALRFTVSGKKGSSLILDDVAVSKMNK